MRQSSVIAPISGIVILAACLLTFGGCSDELPRQTENLSGVAEPITRLAMRPDIRVSKADLGRICRALNASMGGYQPNIMKLKANNGDIARVTYARPSDGMIWASECKIEGHRIFWRTVDAFGPSSGLGRWRTNPEDEMFTFAIHGSAIDIVTTYSDASNSTESYVIP